MNFLRLKTELRSVLRDPDVENALGAWINDVILELAGEYELPTLRLREPASLVTTTSNWVYNLSAATHPTTGYAYLKRVWRVTSATLQQGFGIEPEFVAFDDIDRAHTQTGTAVQRVAIEGDQVGIYPKAVDTLALWFYRRPIAMSADTDVPDGIPEPYHYKVIVPMVVLRAMRLYPDDLAFALPGDNTRALARWSAMLNQGLYGDGTQIGMLHYIQKAQRSATPRVRGASLGGQLSGGSSWGRW
jgi:hypothetical protein